MVSGIMSEDDLQARNRGMRGQSLDGREGAAAEVGCAGVPRAAPGMQPGQALARWVLHGKSWVGLYSPLFMKNCCHQVWLRPELEHSPKKEVTSAWEGAQSAGGVTLDGGNVHFVE